MKDENWDDLRLFLHVATEGGLVGAAERTGISAPTIGRRMLALERATGHSLFLRHSKGYTLAPDGETLLRHVRAMEQQAVAIRRWNENGYELPIVSVACDAWAALLIARNLHAIWKEGDPFRMCVHSTEAEVDLTFREATIALARRRPASGNLAALRSVTMNFAPYATPAVAAEKEERWISIGREEAVSAPNNWVHSQPGQRIGIWTTTAPTLLELVKTGGGRAVLPCFLGDCEPGLIRVGDVIDEITSELWITMHDDDRNRPEVRTVIDRLATFLQARAAQLGGRQQAPAAQ